MIPNIAQFNVPTSCEKHQSLVPNYIGVITIRNVLAIKARKLSKLKNIWKIQVIKIFHFFPNTNFLLQCTSNALKYHNG